LAGEAPDTPGVSPGSFICYNYLMASGTELNKDFKKLADSGQLGHGYLLFGHESAEEKFLFARELANFLETKKWEATNRVMMDASILDAQEEGGIDLVRSASHFLWQKPAVSQKRTLIIDKADNLTLPAQNAILKISEEPPPHALIILIVRDPEVLLPAVVSRFQKIYVRAQNNTNQRIYANAANESVKKFLSSALARRKEILKDLLEKISSEILGEKDLEDFIAGLISELRKDKMKNWPVLKELLHRWTLINQFNVNKRLQLESALLDV